jgi:hypothetical protein
MNYLKLSTASACLAAVALCTGSLAIAKPVDINITDGKGEQVSIKKGWFGSEKKSAKDRLGNEYTAKKGWFGRSEKTVGLLGNNYSKKKGIISKKTEFNSILGDKVTIKDGPLGKKANIDVSGTAAMVGALFNHMSKSDSSSHLPAHIPTMPMPSLNPSLDTPPN